MLGLEGSLLGQTKVVALLLGELGKVDVEGAKVGEGDLLVELLGEHVHAQRVVLGVVPQLELGQNLGTKNQNGVIFFGNLIRSKKRLTWLEKEADMTKLGCPMAQPRLTRRPSARRMMFLPFFKVNRSTCGLMFVFVLQFSSSHLTWGGTSK